jgi:hypothetical protein
MQQAPPESMPGTTKIQMKEPPVKEDTVFNADLITIITKLLHEKKRLGVATWSDKYMKLEFYTPREYQEKIS